MPRLIALTLAAACAALIAAPTAVFADASESAVVNPDKTEFFRKLAHDKYRFTSQVRDAYLRYMEKVAIRNLEKRGKALPDDFLAWIRSDPIVYRTVYGTRENPLKTLMWLRALELDLGKTAVRGKFTQLALATAVVYGKPGAEMPDITPRAPLQLFVPTAQVNPRVNTKDPERTLDRDDHIVNFFLDHPKINGTLVGGMKKELPELVYDKKGVAVTYVDKGRDLIKMKREVIPADVMSSRALQIEFNNYMREKGFDVSVDCGDNQVFPGLVETKQLYKGPHYKGIIEAYKLFKHAFEVKGLLAVRDPMATPAENCAWHIRNETSQRRHDSHWARFPIDAPWPTLIYLAASKTPLREREDLWRRFREDGELHEYGEYTGPVAQDYSLQSARRLSPYPFGYGSIQMCLKDGGVCGTMANIAAESYKAIGVPSCTTAQPGHCALTSMYKEPSGKFRPIVLQCVGPVEMARPFAPWAFGDFDDTRPIVYHYGITGGVNVSELEQLDTFIAYQIYKRMSEKQRAAYGVAFATAALEPNPYFLAFIEEVINDAPQVKDVLAFFDSMKRADGQKRNLAGVPPMYIQAVAIAADKRIGSLKETSADAEGLVALGRVVKKGQAVEDEYYAEAEAGMIKAAKTKAAEEAKAAKAAKRAEVAKSLTL